MIEIFAKILIIALVIIIKFLAIKSANAKKKRQKDFLEKFPIFKRLVVDSKYDEALKMLEKEPVLVWRYKLELEQRRAIAELEIECLEKLNKIPEAVVSLASHLSAEYEIGKWPQELLSKWIKLYKSCDSINIEEFGFCEACGLDPETEALLKYAIEKEGCKTPIGFPDKEDLW